MNWFSLVLIAGGVGLSLFLLVWYLLCAAGSRSSRNESYVEEMLAQADKEEKG